MESIGKQYTLLILDDNVAQLDTMKAILTEEGYQVFGFTKAHQAFDFLANNSVAAAIFDLKMPDIPELELLEKIKNYSQTFPIIINTAYGSYDTAKKAVNVGIFAYLEKGGDPGNLIRQVNRAINSHLEKSRMELEKAVLERTAELKASTEMYQLIAENTSDAIIRFHQKRIVYVSPAHEKLFGYTFEEMLNIGEEELAQLIFEEDFIPLMIRLTEAIAKKEIFLMYQYRFKHKNGDIRWREDHSHFFYDRHGNLESSIVVGRDIHERMMTEQSIRESEEMYRLLAENASDVIWKFDLNEKKITYISPSVERLRGYKPDELIGKPIEESLVEGYSEILFSSLQDRLEKLEIGITDPTVVEIQQYHKNGKILWIEINAHLVKNEKNGHIEIHGSSRDISQRKRKEEELQTLIDSMPDIVCFKDGEGRWLVANQYDLQLFELTKCEYRGKTDLELAEYSPLLKAAFEQCVISDNLAWEAGKLTRTEEEIVKLNGERLIFDVIKVPTFNSDSSRKDIIVIGRDISERKKAEIKLFDSEELHRKLMLTLPDIVFRTDLDGNILFVNNPGNDLADSFSIRKLVGMNVFSIIDEEYIGKAIENTKRMMLEPLGPQEYLLNMPSGIKLMCEVNGDVVYDNNGNPTGMVYVARDVSERKKAESLLLESEKKYRELFEKNKDGISIFLLPPHPQAWKQMEVNEAGHSTLGYSKEEFLNLELSEIEIGITEEIVNARVEDFNKQGFSSFETTMKHKNGTIVYADVYSQVIDYIGYPAVMSIVRDISARKLAEIEIEKNRELYKILAEKMSDVVWLMDLRGKSTYVSPSIKSFTGFTADEYLQQTIEERFAPSSAKHAVKMLSGEVERFANQPESLKNYTANVRLEYKCKDGTTKWGELQITPYFSSEEKLLGIHGVTRDITARKNVEDQLIAAKEKAEESDRLKSAFLANMSHEIRTPMNGILGFMDLLQDQDLTSSERADYISIVKDSSKRLLNTINDIIEISKIESGQSTLNLSSIDINKLVKNIVSFFKPEAEGKGLQLSIEQILPQENSNIISDKVKMESIITNLVKNGLKFTKNGGVHISLSSTLNSLHLSVYDTGIGIPADKLGSVFNRFEQADISHTRPFEGSGLGLSITKAYVEMLGGKISVQSNLGHGTTFSITLPYFESVGQDIEFESEIKEHEVAFSGQTLLIAEDDDISFAYISRILQEKKLNIIRAKTGREAILIAKVDQTIQLILMDIKMPELSGYEACKEILTFRPELPIIAQTAYAFPEDRTKAIEIGCVAYIPKPINPKMLFNLLEKFLN